MVRKLINKSSIVSYSCEEMYSLVCDIPNYHLFLPYCSSASILDQHDDVVQGEMIFSYLGFTYSLVTKNTMRPYESIDLCLVKGDVQALDGRWEFKDLGDGRCQVSLILDVSMHEGLVYRMYNRVIDKLADTMVDRFVKRAYQVYGYGDD